MRKAGLKTLLATLGVALVVNPTLQAGDDTAIKPPLGPAVDFARQIAPVLEHRCIGCHQADRAEGGLDLSTSARARAGGDGGPAIIAGKPEESLLLEMIAPPYPGARPAMPRKAAPLSEDQVALFRHWIVQGASWPDGPALRAQGKSEPTWWSLRPPEDVAPPSPAGLPDDWAREPIDRFIFAALESRGLSPSPQADRRTLIRRVCFDLTGLPPSPTDVEAFARNEDLGAYERLVDRYLDSRQYGERFARHWLDAVRFAESDGFAFDALRPDAWRYRDYVIKSFNDDKPYFRFVLEQIAGDLLDPVSSERIIATGFLAAGPYDEFTNRSKSEATLAQCREDELEELVAAVGQTFLGLTVQCARCHDHKLDPIPQRDYYRFKAALAGAKRGRRTHLTPEEYKRRDPNKPAPMTFAVTPFEPGPTRVLSRGNVEKPGKLVLPGALSAVSVLGGDLGLPADAPESLRRRRLAEWVAKPRNPLTARVMVNRIWQSHFGTGLVATPNDFGAGGERPTHPELLDRLTADFVAAGGRLKPLHRRIVLSRTYRQSSAFSVHAASKDHDDRLLWRFPPRRLEAEEVRDAMLSASGELNYRMGGPGERTFTTKGEDVAPYALTDPIGPEYNRRSIYATTLRSARPPLLDALDCPDPSVKTPHRAATTTPLQSLALMNDPFVIRQAKKLADRARRDRQPDVSLAATVSRAYHLAVARAPSPEERDQAAALAASHGLETVCWALFNSSEFLYVK
jgi:mono/diheme cytochrome c family protein